MPLAQAQSGTRGMRRLLAEPLGSAATDVRLCRWEDARREEYRVEAAEGPAVFGPEAVLVRLTPATRSLREFSD